MKCLIYFGMSSVKEGTTAQLSGRGELHGGARVTTLVTLRKCTLGNKREIKTLKFVSASTKGFKGGLAWIKPSKKDMAVTFSYSNCIHGPPTCTRAVLLLPPAQIALLAKRCFQPKRFVTQMLLIHITEIVAFLNM